MRNRDHLGGGTETAEDFYLPGERYKPAYDPQPFSWSGFSWSGLAAVAVKTAIKFTGLSALVQHWIPLPLFGALVAGLGLTLLLIRLWRRGRYEAFRGVGFLFDTFLILLGVLLIFSLGGGR
jgi:hypothetical protein